MSKLIKGSIDLTKIKKEHIFEGKNGNKYVNIEVWINDEKDKYDNDAGIKQSYKVGDTYESHYIGNGKKGFGWEEQKPTQNADVEQVEDDNSGLPF